MQLYTLRNEEGKYYGGGIPGTSHFWVSGVPELAWTYADTMQMILDLNKRGSSGWIVEKVSVPCIDMDGKAV